MSEDFNDEEPKEKKKTKKTKKKSALESDQITLQNPERPHNPNLPKNYYFDNDYVESLLTEYVKGGCTNKKLRNEIMANASELIRQIIRTHKLHTLIGGKNSTSFGDLYQIAWTQIESSLYKFDYRPGHTKVFNMWCVSPDTMLMTDHGIDTIGKMLYSGTGIKDRVYGLDGFNSLTATLCRPETDTLKIKTQLGYQIEATPEHRFYMLTNEGPVWAKAGDLKPGDLISIQYDQNEFVGNDSIDDIELKKRGKWVQPNEINEELAYILGLFIAEGSWSYGKLVIYNIDQDVIDYLVNNNLGLNFIHEPKYQRISLCNVRFIEFLEAIGFDKDLCARKKSIPDRLLRCSKKIMTNLLKGMFDGDGHSSRHNGIVGYTSSSKFLINQLRMILLNFGMLSKLNYDNRTESYFKGVLRSRRPGYQLTLSSHYSKIFYQKIGFNISRKMEKSKFLKNSKEKIYGLVPHFKILKKKYGCGNFGYNKIRPILKNKSGSIYFEEASQRLSNWDQWSEDSSYQFISERLKENARDKLKIAWLPIISVDESISPVCEITVDSQEHSYIANGFVSHNSQVSKTVMLAYIKKESRDKRNYGAYKEHLDYKHKPADFKMERFLKQAREVCQFNDVHQSIIDALEDLVAQDDKPYDGLIDKLVKKSGMSRSKVSSFLRIIRLRSHDFSDAPMNQQEFQPENKYRIIHANYENDED